MRIELSVEEAVELARVGGAVPPYVRSVTGEGDEIRVSVDLREVPDAPSGLRLAARLVPVVRATLRVESFVAGTAVVRVEVSAGGLPAHKLLGFLDGPLAGALRSQGLPPEAVQILPDARVALDVQTLMRPALAETLPQLRVTDLGYADGTLRVTATL
ncbi:hypothetical protein [Oerskovia flava]|uniref:hypothetical protein n=1 Tax=Oerskovia flava TaxID=2986422 RepID=UPI00223FC389|nr:hypothetical protein [Oerskovia sp. JB1-3-2]